MNISFLTKSFPLKGQLDIVFYQKHPTPYSDVKIEAFSLPQKVTLQSNTNKTTYH